MIGHFCDSISSVGSCTVYNQCTERFAAIYIRECVMVAEIAKFNLQQKFLTLQYTESVTTTNAGVFAIHVRPYHYSSITSLQWWLLTFTATLLRPSRTHGKSVSGGSCSLSLRG